jgi:4-diphosphocytidyl-2-C-methyl-D-erythritol kinase
VKAAELLRSRVGLPELGAAITLEKRIPIGAGLAGGSSNGAAALVGLNALWGCGFSREQLHGMAAELGSDMPFCLDGGTQLCFGRGEVLEPVAGVDAPALSVLLVKHPQASVSTPWAYGRCRELRGDFYLEQEADFEQRRQNLRRSPLLMALRGEAALPALRNDLQAVVEPEVESVRQGLRLLRQADSALAVAMSGSGPSLFALFADGAKAEAARDQLAEPLAEAGFESWVCRCTGSGVTLG